MGTIEGTETTTETKLLIKSRLHDHVLDRLLLPLRGGPGLVDPPCGHTLPGRMLGSGK